MVRIPVINGLECKLDAWEELEDGTLWFKVRLPTPHGEIEGTACAGGWRYEYDHKVPETLNIGAWRGGNEVIRNREQSEGGEK